MAKAQREIKDVRHNKGNANKFVFFLKKNTNMEI